MIIRLVCILFGAALIVESMMTPGLQLFSSTIGGSLIGWNTMSIFFGEDE